MLKGLSEKHQSPRCPSLSIKATQKLWLHRECLHACRHTLLFTSPGNIGWGNVGRTGLRTASGMWMRGGVLQPGSEISGRSERPTRAPCQCCYCRRPRMIPSPSSRSPLPAASGWHQPGHPQALTPCRSRRHQELLHRPIPQHHRQAPPPALVHHITSSAPHYVFFFQL